MIIKKKIDIFKRLGLLIITLICAFSLCCCAPIEETEESDFLSEIYLQTKPSELTEALKIANVYTQFLNPDDTQSEVFRNVVQDALKIERDNYYSEATIKNTADELLHAVEIFHAYLFEPEKAKVGDIDLVKTLSINGAKCAYEESSRTFWFPMGTTPNKTLEFNFSITSGFDRAETETEAEIKISVFAEILDSDENIFPYGFIPELNKPYILRTYSDAYMCDYKIMFTMIPVVQVSNIGNIRDDYRDCIISFTDADFAFSPFETSLLYYEDTAQIHVRGSSARGHPKKSYAIKFVDENKASKEVSFFGIRKDSHWILDAMYYDMARMRNRVSTDLWLSFSGPLYYEHLTKNPVSNGTQGDFVELFINNEYIGLYHFSNKINRQQLQLKRYDSENNIIHGVSYKGKGWDEPLKFKTYYNYDNNSNWWASFQQKYPNPRNGLPIDWKPLYDFIRFVVDSDDETFKTEINKFIDINNFVDYTIFLAFTYAHDNTGKNAYWSVYDIQDPEMSKFFITVWDLKSTWGRTWHPGPTSPNREWMDSLFEHDSALFRRLILTNADGFADKVRARWEEVKVGKFSPDAVKAIFNKYYKVHKASGAFEREAKKWEMGLDLDSEMEYIMWWIDARYEYINDFIMNKLDTVGDFEPQPPPPRRRR